MIEKLNKLNRIWILIFGISFFLSSCEKENSDEIVTKVNFNAPNIDNAKSNFNQKSDIKLSDNQYLKNTFNTLQTDWQFSKEKTYKETPQQNVDILYTPIYLNTDKDAKAFIASTEQNGIIESKIVFALYKSTNNDSGISAYTFVYDLNGNLEFEYNFENGIQAPFSSETSSIELKTIDCSSLPSLTVSDLISWLSQCTIALDEVIVVGNLNPTIDAGQSGGGGSDISPWVQIDGLGYEGGTSSSSGSNPQVFTSNLVSATGFSISTALGLPFYSIESQWLTQRAVDNQSLLNAIAQFLNANKERSPDPAFVNVNPNQLPEIKGEAIDFTLEMINFLMDNPGVILDSDNSLQNSDVLIFDSFLDYINYYNNVSNNPSVTFQEEIDNDGITKRKSYNFNYGLGMFSHTIKVEIEATIPEANSCECMTINNVTTILFGNTTLVEWEQIGDFWTEITNDGNNIKVYVRGLRKTGVKIDGFPFRSSYLTTYIITFDLSTGNTIDYTSIIEY
jgi:hypothetical protein